MKFRGQNRQAGRYHNESRPGENQKGDAQKQNCPAGNPDQKPFHARFHNLSQPIRRAILLQELNRLIGR